MRDIKFRGKRKDNGNWVAGCLVSISPDEAFILIGVTGHIKRDDYECYMVEVDPATVGQWTGLSDKNGIEIYEGDVLRGSQKEQSDKKGENAFDVTGAVSWRQGGFRVFDHCLQTGYTNVNNVLYQFMWCNHGYNNIPDHYYQIDDIEITGNIHDVNPAAKEQR